MRAELRNGVFDHRSRTKFRLEVAQCVGDRAREDIAQEVEGFGISGGDDHGVFW